MLALFVAPIAIEQYPEVFKDAPWILPSGIVIVCICWIVPLLVHDRVRRIHDWVFTRLGKRLGWVVVVFSLAITVGLVWTLGYKLYGKHKRHLEARLQTLKVRQQYEESKAPAHQQASAAPPEEKPQNEGKGSESTRAANEPQLRDGVIKPDVEIAFLVVHYGCGEDCSGTYGLSAIVRVRNMRPSPVYIRQLEIVGDVAVDCGEYLLAVEFPRLKEGETTPNTMVSTRKPEDIQPECKRRKPFRRISWISYPNGPTRIDGSGGEEFIPFDITRNGVPGRMRSCIGSTGNGFGCDERDYLGFEDTNTSPPLLTKVPDVYDLIFFTAQSANKRDWTGGKLREEVESGAVKISLLTQAGRIIIPPKKMREIQIIDEVFRDKLSLQERFYRDSPWNRAMPTAVDPNIPKTK